MEKNMKPQNTKACINPGQKRCFITFVCNTNSNKTLFNLMSVLSKLKLVLVDIDKDTLNLDLEKAEKKITKKTKAILIVHQFGHSADMEKLMALKKKYKLKIIEDNAESLGGKFKNKLNGQYKLAS